MADMPAKIWITMEDHTASRAGAFRRWHASDLDHGDEYPVYIRADLVEPLVEALRKCALVCAGETITKSGLVDALDSARTALSSWESAQ